MLELVEDARVVTGFIVMLFGAAGSAIYWLDKRNKHAAVSAVQGTASKVKLIEQKVEGVDEDVKGVALEVRQVKRDIATLDGRMNSVEKSLETVARQRDIADLNSELKHFSGGVTAELRILSGMMHSFRESALRSAEKGNGK